MFQSLLSWMLLSNRGSTGGTGRPAKVSILVILDVALKLSPAFSIRLTFAVSILVILDVALKLCTGRGLTLLAAQFQSLLSWMLLSNLSIYFCFNPAGMFQSLLSWMLLSNVFCGFDVFDFLQFQSLLSWMLLSNEDLRAGCPLQEQCFNPCYPGCCSQTRLRAPHPSYRW